jgi:hypothetical protein
VYKCEEVADGEVIFASKRPTHGTQDSRWELAERSSPPYSAGTRGARSRSQGRSQSPIHNRGGIRLDYSENSAGGRGSPDTIEEDLPGTGVRTPQKRMKDAATTPMSLGRSGHPDLKTEKREKNRKVELAVKERRAVRAERKAAKEKLSASGIHNPMCLLFCVHSLSILSLLRPLRWRPPDQFMLEYP